MRQRGCLRQSGLERVLRERSNSHFKETVRFQFHSGIVLCVLQEGRSQELDW